MKYISFVLVFVLLAYSAPAQRGGKINYQSDCPQFNYCDDCGDDKAVFLGKLRNYFEKEFNPRDIDVIEGVIIVQVAVDSLGKVCAHKFYNRTGNTPGEIALLNLDKIIERMPQWEPAVVNGTQVNSYVLLAIYSHVDKHGVFDVNYLRNDKEKVWYVVNKENEKMMMYFDESAAKTEHD